MFLRRNLKSRRIHLNIRGFVCSLAFIPLLLVESQAAEQAQPYPHRLGGLPTFSVVFFLLERFTGFDDFDCALMAFLRTIMNILLGKVL